MYAIITISDLTTIYIKQLKKPYRLLQCGFLVFLIYIFT